MYRVFFQLFFLGLIFNGQNAFSGTLRGSFAPKEVCEGVHSSISNDYIIVSCGKRTINLFKFSDISKQTIKKLEFPKSINRVFSFEDQAYAVSRDNNSVFQVNLNNFIIETHNNILSNVGKGELIFFRKGWAGKATNTYTMYLFNLKNGKEFGPYYVADVPGYNPLGFDYSKNFFYQAAGYPGQVSKISVLTGAFDAYTFGTGIIDVSDIESTTYFLDDSGIVWSLNWDTKEKKQVTVGLNSLEIEKHDSNLIVFHSKGLRLYSNDVIIKNWEVPFVNLHSELVGVTESGNAVFLVGSQIWISEPLY